MFKVGETKKLLSPKVDFYECKEVVENPDVTIDVIDVKVKCPQCNNVIEKKTTFPIQRLYIFQAKDGTVSLKGESLIKGQRRLVRFPDKTWQPEREKEVVEEVKKKSKFLKEKDNVS